MKLMVLENYNDNLSYKSYFLRRKMVMMHKIFNKLIVQVYNNMGYQKNERWRTYREHRWDAGQRPSKG